MANYKAQSNKQSKPALVWLGFVLFVFLLCPAPIFAVNQGYNGPAWVPMATLTQQVERVPQPPKQLRSAFINNPSLVPAGPQVTVTIANEDPTQPVITVRADVIESDRDKSLNHFINRVSIIRGEETITADRAIWNDQTNTAELSGNITISTPDFVVMAERALINMSLYTAKIYGGKAFFPAQNYYLSGAVIERLGERVMHIKDGTATTCDGPNPPWTIHASELTVTEGGYAEATGVSFQAGSVSVLHVPWFIIPVQNERQSGLLMPMVADSSRDGVVASLPVFWATGENHDLTFTPVWRSERGLSSTLEGRYHLEEGRGIWAYTYMDDRKHRTYNYTDSSEVEKTGDRYWLRGQNQWDIGDWDVHLHVDLVSDPFFLAEFRDDPDGFYDSYDLFKSEFGHSVNEYLDPMRFNTIFAQKADYDTLMRGSLEYTEDLYSENNGNTIQRLPSLNYQLVGRSLGMLSELDEDSSPIRLSLGMNYDYFYRTTNSRSLTDETGHRVGFSPSLSWSKALGDVATLEVDGALDLMMYSASGNRLSSNPALTPVGEEHNNFDSSLSGSFSGSLSTTFNRVFQGGPGDAEAFRHQMTPKVNFSYVEASKNQGDLPYWDLLDRKLPRRTLRYGVENSFVSKTVVARPAALASPAALGKPAAADRPAALARPAGVGSLAGEGNSYDYFQFLKVDLWASYELTDNFDWSVNPQSRQITNEYREEGAGPIELDVEAFFNSYFSMRLISSMDMKTGDFTGHDLSMRVQDTRGDSLAVAYDFDSPGVGEVNAGFAKYEEIRVDLGLVINSDWRADFTNRYDMRASDSMETKATLLYQEQCYGLGIMLSETEGDRRVGVVVDLLGLGSTSN